MAQAFWCYLLARRKRNLYTTVICSAAQTEGIDMYNTSTLEITEIIKQLWEDLKQHYCDKQARRDKYLLSRANLESNAGDERKANTIRNIKRAERHIQ